MRHVLSYDIVHEGQGNRHYRKPRCGNVLHISFCRDSRDSLGGCKTRDVDNELKAQGARVRWNVESVAADFANAPSLEEIIADAKSSFSDSDQHRGLDRIFEVLSKQEKYRWLFDEIAILYSSTGFTSEDVTSPYYRIIAFNENLFLAFTTKPDGKFYDVLEAFEYRQDNKFHFLLKDFSEDKRFANVDTEGTCGGCHGDSDPRPIFGAYDFWPPFLSANRDIEDVPLPWDDVRVAVGDKEDKSFKRLCNDFRNDTLPVRLTYFKRGISNYCTGNDNSVNRPYDAGRGRARGLTRALAKVQYIRLSRFLDDQRLTAHKIALAGVYAGCHIENWLNNDIDRAAFEKMKTSTRSSILAELDRRAHLYFSLNFDGFSADRVVFRDDEPFRAGFTYYLFSSAEKAAEAKMNIPAILRKFSYPKDFVRLSLVAECCIESQILQTSRLRYVMEYKAGLDISNWSFSREVGGSSYDLSVNGQGAEILIDVLAKRVVGKVLGDEPPYLDYGSIGVARVPSEKCPTIKAAFDRLSS